MQANISRNNNFELLKPAEWIWIAQKILTHPKYKMLSVMQLNRIIEGGIMGRFNDKQYCVNAFTIFKWIETWWKETPDHEKFPK